MYVFISLITSGYATVAAHLWTRQSLSDHSSQLSCEIRAAIFVAVAIPCLWG